MGGEGERRLREGSTVGAVADAAAAAAIAAAAAAAGIIRTGQIGGRIGVKLRFRKVSELIE